MICVLTRLVRLSVALLLCNLLVLTGCSKNVRHPALAVKLHSQYDMTIQAYKSGQFLVDGAVLSALDAGSHFAYLRDIGKLPKTVLLESSEDSKVKKQHLQYMARMQLDYGFIVYYDDGGTLKKIDAVESKARELEDYRAPAKVNESPQGQPGQGNVGMPQQR